MISIEISARPRVLDTSGDRLSVQLMKSARRSEKSQRVCWFITSCSAETVRRSVVPCCSVSSIRTLSRIESTRRHTTPQAVQERALASYGAADASQGEQRMPDVTAPELPDLAGA